MSRTFAYVRVSKSEQETEDQIKEIESAGFNIQPHRIMKWSNLVRNYLSIF